QRARRLLMPRRLHLSEGIHVLRDESLSMRSGLTCGKEVCVPQRHERRLQLAPPEIDHERLDLHELAGDLRKAGDLRDEVVLVESVRTRFGVDLRIGLGPGTGPVAGEAA